MNHTVISNKKIMNDNFTIVITSMLFVEYK